MKQFTAKQRAKIYLEAAERESAEFATGIDLLFEKAGCSFWNKRTEKIIFPELVPFDQKISLSDTLERQQLRVLALLFARELALNKK